MATEVSLGPKPGEGMNRSTLSVRKESVVVPSPMLSRKGQSKKGEHIF